ncbi:MAG: alpha/beta hydrolase fold domain-containing protein, partial [Candidatus Nealsonbacteria bacterium]|nr:alpha/beta hydrolase fold domain-containing protein [Candidatus Nealsonbacteria bacterium]
EVREDPSATVREFFTIRQRVARSGAKVVSVGPVIPPLKPFDEFGRRIFSFNTSRGQVDVVQGITKITPKWTKVEGLQRASVGQPGREAISYIWDYRMSTGSIPPDVLHKILLRQIDQKDLEHRKKIARFYLECERYEDARKTLEQIVKDFSDVANLKEEIEPTIRRVRQLWAQRLLTELQLRRRAGQHRKVFALLKAFPTEGVAGAILQAVGEMTEAYEGLLAQRKVVLEQFDAELAKITDTTVAGQIAPIRKEIGDELNLSTWGRLAAFRQSYEDPELLSEEKISLAVSGWLLGSDTATVKLPVAVSVWRVRDLVRQYLNEPIQMKRSQILGYLRAEEGATPKLVAALLAHGKPPGTLPKPVSESEPGFYRLAVRGLANEPNVQYLVQLPPEYDPYRRYPTIVTLHGAGSDAAHQIDWWAGARSKDGGRNGQAARHGYIVVAPQWTIAHQKKYVGSAREHAAVLNSLRDACKRFAIDTDRVFLSGHSIGGDAAWDIGVAHPDLWAGVIPFVARVGHIVPHYTGKDTENAKLLPTYFVCGELDSDRMTKNALVLDRYFKRAYNCTVVEYLGRGHDHFYDEILRLFDWMGRFRRDFFPKEFECGTLRQWDNYFWWVEVDGLPARSRIDPAAGPPRRGVHPVQVAGRILDNNNLSVRAGTSYATIWLSPEMIDFEQRITITVNGRRMNIPDRFVRPDLETLLEDVRSRGDRQHPFWAKVEGPTGRAR